MTTCNGTYRINRWYRINRYCKRLWCSCTGYTIVCIFWGYCNGRNHYIWRVIGNNKGLNVSYI